MRGYSLVELLVGIALVGVVALGLGYLLNSQQKYTLASQRKANDEALIRPLSDQLEADFVAIHDIKPTSLSPAEPRFVVAIPYLLPSGTPEYYRVAYHIEDDSTCPANTPCKKLVRDVLNPGLVTDPDTVTKSISYPGFKAIRWCFGPGTLYQVPAITEPDSDCAWLATKYPKFFASALSKKSMLLYLEYNSLYADSTHLLMVYDLSNKRYCFTETGTDAVNDQASPSPYFLGREP